MEKGEGRVSPIPFTKPVFECFLVSRLSVFQGCGRRSNGAGGHGVDVVDVVVVDVVVVNVVVDGSHESHSIKIIE